MDIKKLLGKEKMKGWRYDHKTVYEVPPIKYTISYDNGKTCRNNILLYDKEKKHFEHWQLKNGWHEFVSFHKTEDLQKMSFEDFEDDITLWD